MSGGRPFDDDPRGRPDSCRPGLLLRNLPERAFFLAAAQGLPGVTGVAIGAPVVGDTFKRGEQIEATVTFNKAVDVSGTPQLALGIGTETWQASYASGTSTASLVFRALLGLGTNGDQEQREPRGERHLPGRGAYGKQSGYYEHSFGRRAGMGTGLTSRSRTTLGRPGPAVISAEEGWGYRRCPLC